MTGMEDFRKWSNPWGRSYYDDLKSKAIGTISEEDCELFNKALGADSTTTGAEFIPESWSSQVLFELYETSWHRQLFPTQEIPFGYKMNIPQFSTHLVEASGVSSPIDALPTELTSTTAIALATMTTTEKELELKTLAIRLQIQNKWEAYNVDPNILSRLKQEFIDAIMSKEANMVINGDTETTAASNINYTYNASTNVNGVNTATGDNEELLLFDGIRNSATGTAVDASGGAFDSADFRTAIKNMGVYVRKGLDKVAFIVSPDLHSAMLGFTELATMEKYGANAAIVSGEIGRIYGIRVVVSDKMPNTASGTLTNATGIRAASGNNFTEGLLMWVDACVLGSPRPPQRRFNVKRVEEEEYDRFFLVGVEDFGFVITRPAAIVRMYNGTA